MKCRACGEKATRRRGEYDYSELIGLPVRLVGVTLVECESCGNEGVVIPRMSQLHRVIAGALIEKAGLLEPAEVRFLRKWLGLSSADFARRMGVAPATVSRWESESAEARRKKLPGPVDRALRLMVAHEEPDTEYSADALDRAGSERAPALSMRLKAKRDGWRGPQAA